MSLASLYCFALLLDRSPTDEEEDGSVVPLEIPSVAPELFGLLDCGKEFSELLGSRDELDSVVDVDADGLRVVFTAAGPEEACDD